MNLIQGLENLILDIVCMLYQGWRRPALPLFAALIREAFFKDLLDDHERFSKFLGPRDISFIEVENAIAFGDVRHSNEITSYSKDGLAVVTESVSQKVITVFRCETVKKLTNSEKQIFRQEAFQIGSEVGSPKNLKKIVLRVKQQLIQKEKSRRESRDVKHNIEELRMLNMYNSMLIY